jgi:hypothetical protein
VLTSSGEDPAPAGTRDAAARPLPAEQALGPYGQVGSLVLATARALGGQEREPSVGGVSMLRRLAGGLAAPREERTTLRPAQAGLIDAEAIAHFATGQYPQERFPAVVVGSPHGAAAHLAVALRVPWLPAAFDVTVQATSPEPHGEDAGHGIQSMLASGSAVAEAVLSRNAELSVRQVHDPTTAVPGALTLFLRWRRMPAAYHEFLVQRLAPGGPVLLVRDTSTAPALVGPGRFGFQYGGPEDDLPSLPGTWVHGETAYGVAGGFAESLRVWADERCHPLRRIMFGRPEALSAAVADVYRRWLRSAGKTGNRLVVECGRLLDPGQVIRAGLVPFWLPTPRHQTVAETAWWLAGSEPFSQIEVIIEPPGTSTPNLASLAQFEAVARFATRQGRVDTAAARAYPYGTVSARHATRVLRAHPYDLPAPPELPTSTAVRWLIDSQETNDLMVC